jgi:hypothetical protein
LKEEGSEGWSTDVLLLGFGRHAPIIVLKKHREIPESRFRKLLDVPNLRFPNEKAD